jgi:dTDP-D-glucose 4,6-dehydratase
VPEFQCKISFSEGVKEIIAWYKNNPDWQAVDEGINSKIEEIIEAYEK